RQRAVRAGVPTIRPGKSLAVSEPTHAYGHRGICPLLRLLRVGRSQGQSLDEGSPGPLSVASELFQVRPRSFGIHVVRGYRRNAAPIVDARAHQAIQLLGL